MSKSSPITNRIQSALHMRASALKNEDEGLENQNPPIYADDQYGATVKVTGGPSAVSYTHLTLPTKRIV